MSSDFSLPKNSGDEVLLEKVKAVEVLYDLKSLYQLRA
jgi:hypothetical protein